MSLREKIIEEIQRKGPISFAHYIDMALNHPQFGYYQNTKVGKDFVTAPMLGEMFGLSLCNYLDPILKQTSALSIVEFGAGGGELALQMLEHEPKLAYTIVEKNRYQQKLQRELLQNHRVAYREQMPAVDNCIVIANEVLDALPVDLIVNQRSITDMHNVWHWLSVAYVEDDFALINTECLTDQELDQLPEILRERVYPVGYQLEICSAAGAWMKNVLSSMRTGKIIIIDYGDESRALYRPERMQGTIRCYRNGQMFTDVFAEPGSFDITCDVDFSQLAQVALANGAKVELYQEMGRFLLNNKLLDHLQEQIDEGVRQTIQLYLAREARKLCEPEEMGQRYKVLVIEK